MAKATTAARTRKKVRKVVNDGIVHIHASFNNTIITITDLKVLAKVLPLLLKWLQKQLVRPHRSMV